MLSSLLLACCVARQAPRAAPAPIDPAGRYREAREAAARRRPGMPPWQNFRVAAPALLAIASDSPDAPEATEALLAAAEYGSQGLDTCRYDGADHLALMARVLDALAARSRDEEAVGRLCLALPRLPSPAREAFLREILDRSANASVRARARLGLGELLKAKAQIAESLAGDVPPEHRARAEQTWGAAYLGHLRACRPADLRAEAEGLFERLVADRDATPFVRGTGLTEVWAKVAAKDAQDGRPLRVVAEADLDEIRRLNVGAVAPEIEGRDADGRAFRLGDYRGRVVLLTFSGNWCGPCRSMYPQERQLAERLRDRPFALLSVNTDPELATLRRSIAAGEVTWRCWWDGGPGGPIAARWNVRAWPTIYLLDADGVIVAKDPPDDAIEATVDRLVRDLDGRRTAAR